MTQLLSRCHVHDPCTAMRQQSAPAEDDQPPFDRNSECPIAIEPGEGMGIVIPGGGIYLRSAWVTIRMVRHFGCNLPIELWLLPWETITEAERFALDLYGVEIRTAEPGYCLDESIDSTYWNKSIWLAGWQLKVQAVLQSRFARVVYLDADCYPVTDNWLTPLIASPGTFLGDMIGSEHLLSDAACRWLGVTRSTPIDSGALYVDKTHAEWCRIVGALNGPEMVRQTYNVLFGDKDTWWAAHALAGQSYRVLSRGQLIPPHAGIRHEIGLLHRTGDKLTDGSPANTPQHGRQQLEGDQFASQFLRSWPPLIVRCRRDWEIIQGVLELDEYRIETMPAVEYVIDAGGHVGSFSAAMARRWPQAKCLAFEPHADNARLFRLNAPSAELHQIALGATVTTANLTAEPGDTAYETTAGTDIPVRPLSTFISDWPRVDVLKLDIEGDEEAVFQDLCETGQIRKVRHIVGEWHDTDRLYRMMERLRTTHHLTVCCHHWGHGVFQGIRNDQ